MMNIEQNLKQKIVIAASSLGVSLSVEEVVIEKSKAAEHGDYASNVALKNANKVAMNPRQFAEKMIEVIDKEGIDKIEIAGPGFINFFLKSDAINAVVQKIIHEGDNYGRGEKKNFKINVEFRKELIDSLTVKDAGTYELVIKSVDFENPVKENNYIINYSLEPVNYTINKANLCIKL